jgi:hypothetical protein
VRTLPEATSDGFQERVNAAASALLREGRMPTVSLIRARMPGGGSPNRVAPALQHWRLALADSLTGLSGSALDVLPPPVVELMEALWARALFEAHRVKADAPDSRDAQLVTATNAVRQIAARLEQREAQLDEALRSLDEQRARLDALIASAAAAPVREARSTRKLRSPPPRTHGRKRSGPKKPKRAAPAYRPRGSKKRVRRRSK